MLAFLAITKVLFRFFSEPFGYQNRCLSVCQKRKRGIAALDVSNQWIQNSIFITLFVVHFKFFLYIDETFKSNNIILLRCWWLSKKPLGAWGGGEGSPTSLLVLVVVRFPTSAMRPFSAAVSALPTPGTAS